ncbi:MAG TPA: FhaA domain-containing protein [Blastocatellia bacterium]|nr:FhaA domain-containing protein [Blastocatellia bacterium]
MSNARDNVLDRAESLAKRILERVGSKVDLKLLSGDERALSLRTIGALASRLEQLIESTLEEDGDGIRRVAPNRFMVLLTYEETSTLSPQYIEAMGKELTALVSEYIGNRRYVTRGPVEVEVRRDLFAKETLVKASFAGGDAHVPGQVEGGSAAKTGDSRTVCFTSAGGRVYQIELKREGAPAYIGRAAGNAVQIDDPSLSRLHCSLSLRSSGEVIVADLGSANGTWVNENLLGADEARSLQSGDVLEVGDFKFTVSKIS